MYITNNNNMNHYNNNNQRERKRVKKIALLVKYKYYLDSGPFTLIIYFCLNWASKVNQFYVSINIYDNNCCVSFSFFFYIHCCFFFCFFLITTFSILQYYYIIMHTMQNNINQSYITLIMLNKKM